MLLLLSDSSVLVTRILFKELEISLERFLLFLECHLRIILCKELETCGHFVYLTREDLVICRQSAYSVEFDGS